MKREGLAAIAQKLCDAARRRIPARSFFLGDPPCKECIRKARQLRKEGKR